MERDALEQCFRDNLLAIIERRGLKEAALSKQAGLNPRFVTDLREGRVRSPKMSHAMALAEVLGLDVADIIAGRDRPAINSELATSLERLTPDEQDRALAAVRLLFPSVPGEE